ncbi:MAG: YihA family ribosome biogenesis GTP-binding protein [Firmicutes bacterium]|nr:YihA family ribosome biogenesis GTP-binding protein [Bacillota bacterium]
MKIKSAVYALSGVKAEQYPAAGLPEIALVGRSNVGKSSLINALLNRRALARTSGQPGKTQTANFYLINEAFYLVDLPGYGYAKTSKVQRAQFSRLVGEYLETREELKLVLQVVDLRHPPTALDQAMFQYLQQLGRPQLVVANKLDKLKRSVLEKHRRVALANLPGLPSENLILLSAVTKQGIPELWSRINEVLNPS